MDLTDRAFYGYWHEENLRFSDTDMLGHVNNVAFASLIESGRVAYSFEGLGVLLPKNAVMVMVRLEIDYRAELHYPARIQVGSRLTRLGRTSMTIATAVFKSELCAATSVTTLVLIDTGTRRPVPFDAAARAVLERQLPAG